ncbi:MlaD family protein [Chitinilyticum piscinae]|uniref:MCE family protein n=1 Tax=Chitinilyticum piscinae TaxID=2866724 RepID=A0A8J7G0X7_9NEIS|nr:MCE family protein [Chitinilyticum piscinae]MBE9609950.1 MCE family protein [Chitinilyticum piscinae]
MDQSNHFKLGLFVLAALLALGALVLVIGGKQLGSNAVLLESYFDESVQGIDIGSKVKYRGVVVGEVTSLGFSNERYQQALPLQQRRQYVMVQAKVNNPLFGTDDAARARLQAEIGRGLRVKLTPQGLTGTAYLEIDYLEPAGNPPLPLDWQPEQLYIPSARSTVQQIVGGAQDLLGRVNRLPLEQTVQNLNTLLLTANRKLEQMPLESVSKRADHILAELEGIPTRQIASDAAAALADLRSSSASLRSMLADPALAAAPADVAAAASKARQLLENPELEASIRKLNRNLGRIDAALGGHEQDLAGTLGNLRETSDQLKALVQQLNQYPGSLLADPPPAYRPPQ